MEFRHEGLGETSVKSTSRERNGGSRPEVTLSFLRYFLSLQAIEFGYQLSDKLKILVNRALLITYPLNFLWNRHFGRLLLDPRRIIADFRCMRGNLIFRCPGGISDMQLSDSYERSVKDLISGFSSGDAIDVGANFGLFTVLLSRRLGENGTVLSIEPDPFYYRLLKNNIQTNKCRNVLLVNAAAWSSNTTLRLMPHQLGGIGFETRVSESLGVSTNAILARTIDQLVAEFDLKPRFAKIDVEGGEYQVLMGMIESLRSYRPVLAFEALTEETLKNCNSFLKSLHYEVRHLGGKNFAGFPNAEVPDREGSILFRVRPRILD